MSEIASILRTQRPRQLSADEEKLKRDLYEKISPRRRKFIDRIGYENWDPFPEPNEPNDIRTDVTKRTVQQLTQEFVMHKKNEARRLGLDEPSEAFLQGAMQAEAGIDIGDTLVGMHIRPVAVPLRIDVDHVGHANLVMAYSRLPYVGGSRAVYE